MLGALLASGQLLLSPPPAVPALPPCALEARDGYADDKATPVEENPEPIDYRPPPPLEDCEAQLQAAGVRFRPETRFPVTKAKQGEHYCGAEQMVYYMRGPGHTYYNASPRVTCPVALALAKLEQIAQEEAARHLKTRVKRIIHVGTYACRLVDTREVKAVSQHSFANAIDIRGFELADGRTLIMFKDWGKFSGPPKKATHRFMRAVAQRLADELVFHAVLTPAYNEDHWNHLHLDMGPTWVNGTVPKQEALTAPVSEGLPPWASAQSEPTQPLQAAQEPALSSSASETAASAQATKVTATAPAPWQSRRALGRWALGLRP